jgi:sec-independent protein translocase protein TatB
MFANVGWGEMLVLVVVGLVVLGPERLPGAIRWTASALRQARDYLSGVTTQLREDIGPEFDDLRQPLSELQKLRGMTPRAALTKHLLDGDDSWLTGRFDQPTPGEPNGSLAQQSQPAQPTVPPSSTAWEPPLVGPAPFDTDAT